VGVIEDHHTDIVDKSVFEAVQNIRNARKRNVRHEPTPLSGIICCSDCGSPLTINSTNKEPRYVCRRNERINGKRCTGHSIKISDAEQIVLEQIRSAVLSVRRNEQEFAELILKSQKQETSVQIKPELEKYEFRIIELDAIINKIYEDQISGVISEERFNKLLKVYEAEQSELSEKINALRSEIPEQNDKPADFKGFMNLAAKYRDITDLTADLAKAFLEKVVVHESIIKEGTKLTKISQQVDIYFNFIGQFVNESGGDINE